MGTIEQLPAIYASHSAIYAIASGQAESRYITKGQGITMVSDTPVIMLNAPLLASRLGYPQCSGLDILELFAFVHPAHFIVPTVQGLAKFLNITLPMKNDIADDSKMPEFLRQSAQKLLETMRDPHWPERFGAWRILEVMERRRWPWAAFVSPYLDKPQKPESSLFSRLPEWEEQSPRPQPYQGSLNDEDVLDRLAHMTGAYAEKRQGQRDYASQAAAIFSPRKAKDRPHFLLAEAGTGIGKTLGYLAPASLWAEQNQGTVWVSTYTKALQRQLAQESARIWPENRASHDAEQKKVVIRKGRENYLCLLNLEDAMQGGFSGRAALLAQLVGRWAQYSRDGDMVGGDLPGWLIPLFNRSGAAALSDQRGECIYAGCPHFRKCFIERAERASAQADIVIANHALVMVGAARGNDNAPAPKRIIFDEGHHLFHAADSMFSVGFTGREMQDMRRWIIGPERSHRGRRRGLLARLSDVASYDDKAAHAIDDCRHAGELLPSDGWLKRVKDRAPYGAIEEFLMAVGDTVYARDEQGRNHGYGLECEIAELDGEFIAKAQKAAMTVEAIYSPLLSLSQRLEAILKDPPDWLDGMGRARLTGMMYSIGWRSDILRAWVAMLVRLGGPVDPDFVDWMVMERVDSHIYDMGLYRHWLDPGRPLAETVLRPAHGAMITSATLKIGDDWSSAEQTSGAQYLDETPIFFQRTSPFDYARRAEIIIITDIKKGDMVALSHALSHIIRTANGGVLALFTAIRRLREVYARIAPPLAEQGLPLHAQHVDPIDTGTLVDMFRDDPRSSILGTDSLRDGVDVPGHSLKMVVMEAVPWPRPDILHRARRAAFGKTAWDDRIIMGRLAQAFGRLIRRKDDFGRFVMLSPAFPSRYHRAFPEGTPIMRMTLDEALIHMQQDLRETQDIS